MHNADRFLDLIKTVHKLTAYNIQPFTHKTSKTLRWSVISPYNTLNRLYNNNGLRRLKLTPYLPDERVHIKNTFYVRKSSYTTTIARTYLEHESALADVLVAFYYLYPDCKLEIKLDPKLLLKNNKVYKPDAYIKLFTITKTYNFLLELERTRGPADLFNKIKYKCEPIDYKKNNLPASTQILFVWTSQLFNVYARPMDYQKYQDQLPQIENSFKNVIKACRRFNPDKYLFLPLHHFKYLNQPIWLNSRKQKIKLI
ncbi:MAG: hypothetical protein HQ543_03460 [Bacteroidetes bacterium]|nr:hypothetical protein [Bacteroidota bacterium]